MALLRDLSWWIVRVIAGAALLGTGLAEDPAVAIVPRAARSPQTRLAASIRLDVKLIQIPVTVTDGLDRPVLGLRKTDFRIFEDDVEQDIAAFSMSDAPLSVGLVFDTSRSMKTRIADSREAVEEFLHTASPADQFLLVQFSDKAKLVTPFTHTIDEISRGLSLVEARGWTAMIDAVYLAAQQMRRAENPRKALLVLTDGQDNNSRYSESELLSILREADLRVFAISLFQRPQTLDKIADETGGRVIWVHKLSELPDAMDTLSRQIRTEYLLGYFSKTPQNDGRYHKVRIQLKPSIGPDSRVTWRRGYFAPND